MYKLVLKRRILLSITVLLFFVIIFCKNKSTLPNKAYQVPLSKSDYNRLYNLTDFRFLINHKTCRRSNSDVNPRLVFLVYSSVDNIDHRNTIRNTWGYHDPMSVIYFLLAAVPDNREKQQSIIEEDNQYQDIIQGNFIDSYYNLTYKTIMALKYVTYHCPHVDFFLKIDDDHFINTPYLYHLIKNGPFYKPKNFIFGYGIEHSKVPRQGKWQVKVEEISEEILPNYAAGGSVTISIDVVRKLYYLAQVTKFVQIEDIFLTGMVRKQFGTPVVQSRYLGISFDVSEAYLHGQRTDVINFVFGPNPLKLSDIQGLWNITSKWNYTEKVEL